MRPKLLDLFCCQGGAAVGYHRAGFDVVGVDITPQSRYPFEFVQADALMYARAHGRKFDAIHASPPCQDHSPLKSRAGEHGTGWLLPATIELLHELDVPFVIENVMGAKMPRDLVLCGEQFDLRTVRHRKFHLGGFSVPPIPHPKGHKAPTSTKKRRSAWEAGFNISVTGDIGSTIGGLAMGIDWMTGDGLSQAIPPAYTEYIGQHLLASVHNVRQEAA